MKVITVTGTPATGKTTLAKQIASSLGYDYIDVNSVIKEHGLCEDYDKARHCTVVDIDKLNAVLLAIIDKSSSDLVIDSHMSHFLPHDKVDLVIITKCSLKELEKRLKDRHYPKTKVRENLDSEIFDICLVEAQEQGHTILEVDTDSEVDIDKIKKKLKN